MCGALAGSVATIGAAFAMGWATREAARISARSQHRMERMTPRESRYKEFILAAYEVRSVLGRVNGFNIVTLLLDSDDYFEAATEAGRRVNAKLVDVALAGPETVSELARSILKLTEGSRRALFECSAELAFTDADDVRRERGENGARTVAEIRQDLTSKISDFEREAQRVLDDDGSR